MDGAAQRGMAEMTLIKLGEIVDKPQAIVADARAARPAASF